MTRAKVSVVIERFISLHNEISIAGADSFNNRALIPSGPVAVFFVLVYDFQHLFCGS